MEKHLDLARELKQLGNMEVTMRAVIFDALGAVLKGLKKS